MTATRIAPGRSLEQRMSALQIANDVRIRRSQLKRDLKGGRAVLPHVLIAPADYVDNMKVGELLLAVPRIGVGKTSRMLRSCGISPAKTVGGLTDRQRSELVALITHRRAA